MVLVRRFSQGHLTQTTPQCVRTMSHPNYSCRFGDIKEAVGVVDRPLAESRCETLAHALLSFQSGKMATLYCHFNRIPMTRLPFFQIFGDKVREAPHLSVAVQLSAYLTTATVCVCVCVCVCVFVECFGLKVPD